MKKEGESREILKLLLLLTTRVRGGYTGYDPWPLYRQLFCLYSPGDESPSNLKEVIKHEWIYCPLFGLNLKLT